jgi:membrane-associated phospholipid phosphatase
MRPNAEQAQSHLSFYPPLTGLWSDHADGFPSGEAGATLAIAATLCLLIPRLSGLWVVLGLLGPLVRLVPGMHYFSDVVAGGLIGWLLASWVTDAVLRKLQAANQPADTIHE